MNVRINYSDSTTGSFETTDVVAGTEAFPFWAFWMPIKDEEQEVLFVASSVIETLSLTSPVAEEQEKGKLISFPGGDSSGPVPAN